MSPSTSLPRVAGAIAATATASGAVAAATWYSSGKSTQCIEQGSSETPEFRIQSDFMQHIQSKCYLDTSSKDDLPSTLRIMAIDLPEMRDRAFRGTCRIAHSGIYVDDVPPPKVVTLQGVDTEEHLLSNSSQPVKKENKEKGEVKLLIAQKALVKSLVHCHRESSESPKQAGVSLLEASIEDMNVHRIRKTHQFGSFKHDPGKYYSNSHTTRQLHKVEKAQTENGEIKKEETKEEEEKEVYIETEASFEDEMNAPWNQYAWIEEMTLRLNGRVSYGAPMERSSHLSQALGMGVYRTTIPTSKRWWLPSWLQSSPDGLDSMIRPNCRASNKPHAVIANGAALQLVPSSLRLLQKLCREANVPLFVIHDPRIWGGNTHDTLPDALREMQQTIKKRIINQALNQQGSSAFARGRLVGQLETNAKWQAKERARKLFSYRKQQQPKHPDWSHLDEERLETKLKERRVIQNDRTFTPAMKAIASRYVDGKTSETTNDDSETVADGV